MKGLSFTEGAETRLMSPNNNSIQERPAPCGDDIVRTAGKPVESKGKLLRGNILEGRFRFACVNYE